jgi:hypothetical protein
MSTMRRMYISKDRVYMCIFTGRYGARMNAYTTLRFLCLFVRSVALCIDSA